MGAAVCAALVSGVSLAAFHWEEGLENFRGYGGDYYEFVKADFDVTQWQSFFRLFPLAVPKTYYLTEGGKVVINSHDVVGDYLSLSEYSSPIFYINASASLWGPGGIHPAVPEEPNYNLYKKYEHVVLVTQSILTCPNENFASGLSNIRSYQDSGGQEALADVEIYYCPEGGFPITGWGEYWHGIK